MAIMQVRDARDVTVHDAGTVAQLGGHGVGSLLVDIRYDRAVAGGAEALDNGRSDPCIGSLPVCFRTLHQSADKRRLMTS